MKASMNCPQRQRISSTSASIRRRLTEKLAKHAAERGEALSQMALKWVLKDDKVTSVLVGASSKEQILENIGAVEGNLFTLPELRELEEIVSPVIYD